MKKFLSLLLAFSFVAESQVIKGGQTEISDEPKQQSGMSEIFGSIGGGMGGMGPSEYSQGDQNYGDQSYQGQQGPSFISPRASMRRNSLNLPQVNMDSKLCTFGMGDEVSQDDRLLLQNARQLADSLRNNSEQCRQATMQNFDAFDKSITDFNNFTDSSRPLNPDSQIQANCSNYERFYDIQYDQFVNTWENSGVRDMFSQCRSGTRDEAFTCAQELISSARVQKSNTCETSREFISSQRSNQLQVDTLRTGMDILTSMLNNDQCLGEDGQQRMNVVQSAVSLASRAASLSVIGTPIALGIGAVTGLLQSAIGKLFRKGNRDPYLADQNQQNFEKVACLYEQVEAKARRCDRDSSEQYVARERGRLNKATQACEVLGDVNSTALLIQNLSSVIGAMPTPARTPAGEAAVVPAIRRTPFAETFNALMERLVAPTNNFGGTDETPMSVGLQSAQDVINNIDLMLAADSPHLDTYIAAKSASQEITNPARNRERARLRQEKSRAEALKNLLTVMNEVGNSSNQSPEDLARAENAMASFNRGSNSESPLNFAGAFNQVLSMRAELSDDLGDRINTWKSRLDEFKIHQDVINRFNQNVAKKDAAFNDAGSFQNQVAILRPYLKNQMETELRRLSRNAQVIVQDTSRENVTNARSTNAENILWPMVRACNLLQTVNADDKGVCAKISCADGSGVKTFADYLSQENRNRECTAQSCPAEYNTFICQNKGTGVTAAIGDRLKNEYVSNGTVCGLPWNQVFSR